MNSSNRLGLIEIHRYMSYTPYVKKIKKKLFQRLGSYITKGIFLVIKRHCRKNDQVRKRSFFILKLLLANADLEGTITLVKLLSNCRLQGSFCFLVHFEKLLLKLGLII